MLTFSVIAGVAAFDTLMFLLLDPALKETAPLFVPTTPNRTAVATNAALGSGSALDGRPGTVVGDDDDNDEEDDSGDGSALLGGGSSRLHRRGERQLPMGKRLRGVLRDADVVLVFGALTVAAMNLASLEPTLPFFWLERNLTESPFLLGLAFSAAAAGYLLATPLVAWLGSFISRYLVAIAGMLLMGLAMLLVSLPLTIGVAAVPLALLGIGMAMTNVSAMPMLATLVDKRHAGEFDLIFLLSEMSTNIGQIVGALGGAFATRYISILWATVAFAGFSVLYAPLLIFTRRHTRERFKIEPFSPNAGAPSAPATPAKPPPPRRGPLLGGQVNVAALMGLPPPGTVSSASPSAPTSGASSPPRTAHEPHGNGNGNGNGDSDRDDGEELLVDGDAEPTTPLRAPPGSGSAGGPTAGGGWEDDPNAATPPATRFNTMVSYLLHSQAMMGPYSYSASHQRTSWGRAWRGGRGKGQGDMAGAGARRGGRGQGGRNKPRHCELWQIARLLIGTGGRGVGQDDTRQRCSKARCTSGPFNHSSTLGRSQSARSRTKGTWMFCNVRQATKKCTAPMLT